MIEVHFVILLIWIGALVGMTYYVGKRHMCTRGKLKGLEKEVSELRKKVDELADSNGVKLA